jgi:hypothetical protein
LRRQVARPRLDAADRWWMVMACAGYHMHPRCRTRFLGSPRARAATVGDARRGRLTAALPTPIAQGCPVVLAPSGWPEP